MTKETVGRYKIQSEIGRGGMATVFLAYDPNFRRNVAIKLVASNLQSNDIYRGRFEREAHLIAKIEHPAIVPVYDYGEHDDDLYLVMRYMTGGSLAGKLKAGVLTLRDTSQSISQIAPALDAVHAQGIIHRDLKPGNILFDSFGNPAISDFGIAHFTSATTDLTGSAIIGTPSYMSPEQVRGEALDGRSDIYALGVILFEMLAGRGPFQSTTPLSIAFKHLTDPIPSIRLFRPNLPAEMERIFNKAMAKDREMRYSTAAELAADLRAVSASFQEGDAPVLNLVQTPNRNDASTELDVNEGSQPAVEAPRPSSTKSPAKIDASRASPQGPISGSSRAVKRSSLRPLQLVAIAGAVLILFVLCGSLGVFGTWAGLRGLFAAHTPTVSPAGSPALAPTSAVTVQDTILFSDDFSDPNSGWPAEQNDQGTYSYQPDGYHIFITGDSRTLWAFADGVYDDTSISVDATPLTEGAMNYYGLTCRIQEDKASFYYFVVRGSGDFAIGKHKNNEFQSLFSEAWRQSDGIHQGTQTNQLKADCSGNTLRFYANNIMLGEATDPDFTSGFSGVVAATLDDQDFEVRFNNFLITR